MDTSLLPPEKITELCKDIFNEHMHEKRCRSISYGVAGVIYGDDLSVSGVGRGLARARGTIPKHGIKQVDRLLSNDRVEMDAAFSAWVPWVVGSRENIVVAMDWTDHAHDGHTTIAIYLLTSHGRATPLIWMTVESSTLKGNRNEYEREVLSELRWLVPRDVTVTVVADRGFGDTALYAFMKLLKFHYVIRFRGVIKVRTADGEVGKAKDFLLPTGKAKRYDNVRLTGRRRPVPAIVTVRERGMKDAWYLATDLPGSAKKIVKLYGKRFTIEETFRDEKDPHFGMGLSQTHIGSTYRRDRLLLLAAIAHAVLTLIGRAGEQIGLDKKLRANTVDERTHSLYRQGREYVRGAVCAFTEMLSDVFLKLLQNSRSSGSTFAWI